VFSVNRPPCRPIPLILTAAVALVAIDAFAQPNRISGKISDAERFTLAGHLPRMPRPLESSPILPAPSRERTRPRRGQTVTLYFTGAGMVQPSVATGQHGKTPAPVLNSRVTIGGAEALLSYVGIPSWSIGTVQVNFTVPSSAALGAQPVVVYVGEAASESATLTITQ
jgi:uncharacterized protein (TIGR03437 family)